MDSNVIGKVLMVFGGTFLVAGFLFWVFGKALPIGNLPGDVHYRGEQVSVSFPIMTSIILSVVLTVIINVLLWVMRK
jgi:hypothetical protein